MTAGGWLIVVAVMFVGGLALLYWATATGKLPDSNEELDDYR